jgi:hypothetical protein
MRKAKSFNTEDTEKRGENRRKAEREIERQRVGQKRKSDQMKIQGSRFKIIPPQ